jgi:hypothetical protein
MARASSRLDSDLRALAFDRFLAAVVLATLIGTPDVFPGEARRRARWWLLLASSE